MPGPGGPPVSPVPPAANWAGNVRFAPARWAAPASIAELQELVAGADRVRVLGAGHSFSPLAETTGLLLSLRRLLPPVEVDPAARQAWVAGAATYAEVAPHLDAAGWALANLASLPQVTVAGACATATHGSGLANPCLAAAVTAVELVTADGSLVTLDGDLLPGAAAPLGALGAVTRLRLAVEPRYEVAQEVRLDVPLDGVLESLDRVLALGDSVSLFTDWSRPEVLGQLWVKRRLDGGGPTGRRGAGGGGPGRGGGGAGSDEQAAFLGGRAATGEVHPIAGADPVATTAQQGLPGPWHERLPHFRAQEAPSGAGAELQSEWLVARADGPEALVRLRQQAGRLAPALLVCEVRAVAADELWLSPAYRRDSLALHLTWRPDPDRVTELLPVVEEALAPFAPRPHWGKLWAEPPRPERAADFRRLAASLDPERCFANDLLERFLLEGPGR